MSPKVAQSVVTILPGGTLGFLAGGYFFGEDGDWFGPALFGGVIGSVINIVTTLQNKSS
jgi:hypothetical protein